MLAPTSTTTKTTATSAIATTARTAAASSRRRSILEENEPSLALLLRSSSHSWDQRCGRWLTTSSSSTTRSQQKEEAEEEDGSAAAPTDEHKGTSIPETNQPPPQPQEAEKLEFQAETRQLLDIVTNSLYTDKEVFLRELISNASDSCEKLRHIQQANVQPVVFQPDMPFEIRVDLDEVTSTITITDTGIGMTPAELKDNLGTIAKSGSKAYVKALKEGGQEALIGNEAEMASRGIIGKFGVGFYSAFMVGAKIEVRSKSAIHDDGPHVWTSEGSGTYTITPLEPSIRQDRGTSIVIHLKEDYWDFVDEQRIEKILRRYSNFVNFPIFINGSRANTVQAIWSQDPKTIDDATYNAFYQYVANAIDEPLDTYHFRVDAPLDLSALLFTPSFHSEKYGMGRMESGVSLYSRKVLIEAKSTILPDWLRFLKGVVDSEDLPLAISREKSQDTALLSKIRRALTRKYIAHLSSMIKNDKEKYLDEFYPEYEFFLKEGVCQDYEFQVPLSKLLFYETSKSSDLKSLDEYISSMRPEQKDIYYVVAPNREAALSSPYLETFDKAGVEVLLLYNAVDDFVMANLERYEGRALVSADKADIDLSALTPTSEEADDNKSAEIYESDRALSSAESTEFCEWFRTQLGETKVDTCTVTSRLSSSPAIVVDNESGVMRRVMRLVDTSPGARDGIPLPKQRVEINPKHAIIVGIYDLIHTEPMLAKVLAAQVYDNCLVAAGLLDDSRTMLPRLNDILLCVVKGAQAQHPPTKSEEVPLKGKDADPPSKARDADPPQS